MSTHTHASRVRVDPKIPMGYPCQTLNVNRKNNTAEEILVELFEWAQVREV